MRWCGLHLRRDYPLNSLSPRRNEHFADDIFKRIFFNENVWISIKISLKFVPKGLINNIPSLVQIMAWRRSGDKPLSEPMMVGLPTYICVTRPQWVKTSNRQQLPHRICVYPVSGHVEAKKNSFFDELRFVIPTSNILILSGDCSGHMGNSKECWEWAIARFCQVLQTGHRQQLI